MTRAFARLVRAILPRFRTALSVSRPIEAVTFADVAREGWDIIEVRYEHGAVRKIRNLIRLRVGLVQLAPMRALPWSHALYESRGPPCPS